MYQGFYNLASGMLTQSRNLNVVSNNMVNLQTAGYKRDQMVSSTFQEEMLYRTGRRAKGTQEPLATTSKIRTASRTYVNYDQGSYETTEGIYDFAIGGKGFFCIQTQNGVQYTRNGSFAVDEEGYLVQGENGRVLSTEGQAIRIENENFTVDAYGHITAPAQINADETDPEGTDPEDTGAGGADGNGGILDFGTIRLVDFADYEQLHKEDNGLFSTNQAATPVTGGETQILWKTLEKSNVDMVSEMTAMMSSQRALQSAAQVLKMYDTIMGKSASDVGRV